MPLPYELALVTGASSGIGAAIARRLSREGVPRIRLLARRRDRLEALAAELPGAEVVVSDLSSPSGLEAALEATQGVDLLVNNAGFGLYGPFVQQDAGRLMEMVTLNCLVPVRLASAVLPDMVSKGKGAIVNVASGMAFQPSPFMATYAATKVFLLYWSEALHFELRGTGVRALVVCPGTTPTEFNDTAGAPIERMWQIKLVTSRLDEVVDDTIQGLRSGASTVVPGLSHRLLASLGGLSPRWLRGSVLGSVLRPR